MGGAFRVESKPSTSSQNKDIHEQLAPHSNENVLEIKEEDEPMEESPVKYHDFLADANSAVKEEDWKVVALKEEKLCY